MQPIQAKPIAMEATARILSTKKLLSNQRQYLLNAGLAVTEADFINVQYIPFLAGNINNNLIFTSQNGFKAFSENKESIKYKGSNVFCVGDKTKDVINAAGFTVTASADNAESLAAIITEKYPQERFTFFAGSIRRDTLPEGLQKAGILCNEIEVYTTVLTPHKILSKADGLLFFSPSGVAAYLQENTITNEACFCIGTTTAQALAGIAENIIVANRPSVENVIIQCINYYK